MDEMNLNGNPTPDAVPVTDIPDSFGDAVIPDPVASPDSYSDSVIPDPVASPDSYNDFAIPTPEPVTESISVDSVVSPMMEEPAPQPDIPQSVPTQEPQPDSQYSGHYSWNGNQYVDNSASQNGYAQSGYASNNGSVPNYQQPVYSQNVNGQMNLDPELEGRASSVQTLGIVSLIMCILGGCGCGCIGPIISIVGLVKANGMSTVMHMMSEQGQNRVKLGKTLCIVGIILGVISMLIGFACIFLPILLGYMEAASM